MFRKKLGVFIASAAVVGAGAGAGSATYYTRRHYGSGEGGGNMFSRRRLEQLEGDANRDPLNGYLQYSFIRALNEIGQHQMVVNRVQSGRFAVSSEAYQEYIKALSSLGKLDSISADSLVKPLTNNNPSSSSNYYMSTAAVGGGGGGNNFPNYGASTANNHGLFPPYTNENPLVVKLADTGPKSPLLRGLRWGFSMLPFALGAIIVYTIFQNEKGGAGGGGGGGMDISRIMLGSRETKAPVERPNKKFSDVRAANEAKEELEEIVAYLRDPKRFHRLGGKISKGVLLTGPPGNGKTLLAKAVAGEAGVPFFYASASEFEEMFVGVGARRVRELFATARKHQPCIVFIDELDAVGGKREMRESQYSKMTLNQLLVELDGFLETDGVIVIGATNLPGILDKALVRPGRFDRTVFVPLPDIRGRRDILDLYAKNVPLANDVDLDIIARATAGLSGAELASIINTAAVRASALGHDTVNMNDIIHSKDKVTMGPERKSALIPEEVRRNTAFHESGHCLVSLFTPGSKDLHQITIMPRGQALGMNQFLESEINANQYTREGLMAMIDCAMGGTAAEEIIFGPSQVSTGASNDLEQATNLAHAYIATFGMGDLGKISVKDPSQFSPDTLKAIDDEKRKILNESYARVVNLLKAHKKDLDLLAGALLERETLSSNDVKTLLKIK